jgi:hypothetical protein
MNNPQRLDALKVNVLFRDDLSQGRKNRSPGLTKPNPTDTLMRLSTCLSERPSCHYFLPGNFLAASRRQQILQDTGDLVEMDVIAVGQLEFHRVAHLT